MATTGIYFNDHEHPNEPGRAAFHQECGACGKEVCCVGEQGLTDDCPDAALGLRVGPEMVHLGACRVVGVAGGELLLSVVL